MVHFKNKKYLSLKAAAEVSGYSSDYIGYLIRTRKIKGKKVYNNISWQTTRQAIIKYCRETQRRVKDFDIQDKNISLKEAAKISGYAPDYIGYLIRKGKIFGKKVYTSISWLTTEEAIRKYKEKKKLTGLGAPSIFRWSFYFPLRASKYAVIFATFGIIIFSGLVARAITPKTQIQTVEIYPTQYAGDWQNSQNIQGQPEVGPEGDFNSFSEANSAIYQGGSLNLILSDFNNTQTDLGMGIEEEQEAKPQFEEQPEEETQLGVEETEETQTLQSFDLQNLGGQEEQQEQNLEEGDEEEQPGEIQQEEEQEINNTQQEESSIIDEEESFGEESEPTSFLEKIKRLFGNLTVKAQQIPTFEELNETKFQSAKIKFSFAIDEKIIDLELPQIEEAIPEIIIPGEEVPSEEQQTEEPENIPLPQELNEVEPQLEESQPEEPHLEEIIEQLEEDNQQEQQESIESTPPVEDGPTSFWDSAVQILFALKEKPWRATQNFVKQTKIWAGKAKNFFGILVVKAQEDIQPIETITPPVEEFVEIEEEQDGETQVEVPKTEITLELPVLDTKIIIWYSIDGETWWELDTISDYSLSNTMNGGYFSYDAPFLKSWEDVKNLKIKFEGVIGGETVIIAYLDSVWVEVNYQEKEKIEQQEEPEIILFTLKKDFKGDEEPRFRFKYKKTNQSFLASVGEIFNPVDYWQNINTNVQIIDPEGGVIEVSPFIFFENNGEFLLKIRKPKEFRPGLYKLILRIADNGNIQEFEQEFSWGVLAINVNKSIYLPEEIAYIQMAALRDDGYTICDANLQLEVVAPDGNITFSQIQKSDQCGPDNVTDVPDYFSYYQAKGLGEYQMKLKNLDTGHEIIDSFEVLDSVPFDIERIGPTRIYPPADYEMQFKIKANEDFLGEVKEFVPESFEIESQFPIPSFQSNPNTQIFNDQKTIIWQVEWKKGESYELKYVFDAPNISPYLYLLGSLEIGSFKETRQWQIAADADTGWKTTTSTAAVTSNAGDNDGFEGTSGTAPTDSTTSNDGYMTDTNSGTGKGTDGCGTFPQAEDDQHDFYNFAFSVPGGVTINGIEVQTEGKTDSAVGVNLFCVALSWNAGSNWTAAEASLDMGVTDVLSTMGGSTYDWGRTWSDTEFSDGNFRLRVMMDASNSNLRDFSLDLLQVKVYYSTDITVSGGCFTDDTEGTPCTDDGSDEIKVAVNGVVQTGSDTTVDDNWSFQIPEPPSGATMVFFRNGEATESQEATTVTKYDGDSGDVTLVKMYESQLVIGTDSGSTNSDQTVAIADMDTDANGWEWQDDEDVMFDVTAGDDLIVDANGDYTETLYIISGDTYRPASAGGGDTTTHHLKFESTLTTDNNAVNVAGDFTNAGTFTSSTSTITFNGSTAQTFTTNGATYNVITLNNTGTDGANDNVTISGALDVNSTFNITNGDLILNSGDPNVNTAGDVTIGSSAFVTKGAGTWTFDGTTQALTDSTSGQDLGTITIGPSTTTTVNTGSNVTVTNVTINGDDTLNITDDTLTITGTGTPFTQSGTFTITSSTVVYTGTSATNITSTTYNNLNIGGASTTTTYTAAGNIIVTSVLTIVSSSGTNTFDAADKTITLSGTGTPFVINATEVFTESTSTVVYSGNTVATNITSDTYYNLNIGGSGTTTTYTAAGNITVTRVLTIVSSSGTNEFDAADKTITLSGTTGTPFVINATEVFTSSSSTIQYTGDNTGGNTNVVSTTYNNLYLSNGSEIYDAAGDITVTSVFTINAGEFDAQATTLTLSGSGTPFVISGTFTDNSSTVKYTGDGATNITATTYNNLEFSPTITASRVYTGAGVINVGGTLNINPSAASSLSLTFNLGNTTSVTGATTIQRTSSATSVLDTTVGNHTFNTGSLSIQAGGTLTGNGSALDSNGDVAIAASGTLTSTSGNFNVGGSWSNVATGVFTHNSGTVIFDATTTGKTISDGGDAFNNLQFTGNNGEWTYTDGASTAPNATTVNCTSCVAIFINAKTGTSPTVTNGTLNVDWYLGIHVVDAANTATNIDTGDADITVLEANSASTVWRHNGSVWGSGASSQTTGTDSGGQNPQPTSDGAIRIREYSMTDDTTCPGVGCTLYEYNVQIAEQTSYGEYDYYTDYGNEYITSCLVNTSTCDDDGSNSDDVIGSSWYRATPGSMNGSKPYDGLNEPPDSGSWYLGMFEGLDVTLTGTSINFGSLDDGNNFTVVAGTTTDIEVTTSATSGYVVTAWETQLMTCSDAGQCGANTIQNFTQGTYANPDPWGTNCEDNSSYCGFGFTSDDPSVEGLNRYNNGTEYTFFPTDSSAPVRVMDYGGPVDSQSYSITYKISADITNVVGPYSTTVIYVVTAQY